MAEDQVAAGATSISAKDISNVTVADIAPSSQLSGSGICCLEHNQTVAEAMKILAQHGILSAPVLISPDLEDLSELRAETPRPSLAGWLDVNDIVQELIRSLGAKVQSGHMLQMMAVLEQEGTTFAERPLISLIGGKDKRLVYEADSNIPVLDAIRKYFLGADDHMPVHRLAIFHASGQIEKIISQMDVLRFFRQSYADATWGKASLQEAGLINADRPLEGVEISTPTVDALQKLVAHNRSAVAVLSPDRKLISNLSTSDLRYLQPNHFGVLALPVGEFLSLLHGTMYVGTCAVDGDMPASKGGSQSQFFADAGKGAKRPVPLISVSATETVMGAIRSLLEHRVHRVYVVQDPREELPVPLAVVTATDLLQYIAAQ